MLLHLLIQTAEIIQRLENILSVPGTVAEKQLFITEVILPEVSKRRYVALQNNNWNNWYEYFKSKN